MASLVRTVTLPRGRSVVRGAKRRRASTSSGSRLVRRANQDDGRTRRGWSYPQGMSEFFDPFPCTMRAVLRYSEVFQLDATTGGTAHHLFRCGSIFDPNQTGAGHQPYGRDTYALIYNHYRVIKSSIKVSTNSGGGNAMVGITVTDDPTVSSTYDTVREIKPTKFVSLANSPDSHSLTAMYDAKQSFTTAGLSNTLAPMGANPVEEQFFDIWQQGNTISSDPGTINMVATILYYCEFSELKDLGQS